jgi:hypothetical protein
MRLRLGAFFLVLSVAAFAPQFGGRARALGGQFGGFGGQGATGGTCLVPGYRGSGIEDVPTPRDIRHQGFIYARVRYHVQPWWRGGEIPWHHDYSDGDTMFPASLNRLTETDTDENSFQLVDIDSKELFKYPFLYMSEPGYLDLRPDDVKNLREYLDRGGFLLMDDFRGNEFDNSQYENMEVQMKKLYPEEDIKPVLPTHQIFHSFYDLDPKEMLPPYRMRESGEPAFLGISDKKGNLRVMIDFNNDISEYWQALDIGACSIREAGMAVKLGVNYAIYAMTH